MIAVDVFMQLVERSHYSVRDESYDASDLRKGEPGKYHRPLLECFGKLNEDLFPPPRQ